MTATSATALIWALAIIASLPIVFVCARLWKRSERRRLTLRARETYYSGTFMDPPIDLDELERMPHGR